MKRQWTQQQHSAIYATDGSVLVSAAAGSGKTAVLVERVINLITRENNPIDVDRLLIVTFTRAAAAEMRQRLSNALTQLIENDPYNSRLLKQKQLLYNASISTIDSFCSDLVREYFHTLDISRDFRIADEGELKLLKSQALENTFEYFYNKHSDFISLVDAFSSKGGDIRLRETVLKISDFLSTQPFPDVWLDNMLNNYSKKSISDTIWGRIIAEYSLSATAHAINLTENSLKIIKGDEKLEGAFISRLEEDLAYLNELQRKLLSDSWNDVSNYISNFEAGRLTAPRGYKDHPIKLSVSSNRDEVKDTIKQLNEFYKWDEQLAESEIASIQKLVKVLFELVRSYTNELGLLKSKKNILSFADIESLTVKLLASYDADKGYTKTTQADEISARYDAVMVDEFQDVNDVQDLIFRCVSTDENNLFVVGDVKQSIYGFRQAKPEIFINRKAEYNRFEADNPQYPATIILDKNFRSRKEICNAVNFIFSKLMSKSVAQMDYTNDERLNVGAVYPENSDCNFEIALIEKNSFDDMDATEVEAQYIASKIHKMISEGFEVTDGGKQRKVTYNDFAIILRSPGKKATTYVNTLINNGIPAYSENKGNFFDVQEVKIILNLLRIIDNPTLDIPLLSVMCSPIYGFTPDELAEMRADSLKTNLYSSVMMYAETNKKAKDFVEELNTLRKYSFTCGVDEIISRVYEVTSFVSITAAVKGNTNSSANLNILREYARNFETSGYKTLSDFISFIDRLIENGMTLPAASSGNGELNGVRVLSIHASKGLEFPVCFIADTAHRFNKTDLAADVLVDSKAGLGIRLKDGICRYNTLPRVAVGIGISQNEIAEELRVLYVALTRAREKLIIVSSQKNVDKYLSNLYSKIVFDTIIEPYSVMKSNSISDWVMLCALTHPSLNAIRKSIDNGAKSLIFDDDTFEWNFNVITCIDDNIELEESNHENQSDESICLIDMDTYCSELLNMNLAFEYKNSDIMSLPQKVSASQLAHSDSGYFDRILNKPMFMKSESVSAVERGTAHHRFLQYCDIMSARRNIELEINRLKKVGKLTDAQAETIDIKRMQKLINSELFDRIMKSDMVYREEQFFVNLKPSLVFDDYKTIDTEEDIIVQGAVDIAFVEDGKLVIVDYKTDRVKDISKLSELYSKQLDIYKYALAQSFEIEVKECIICSVQLGEYITL